MEYEPTIPTPPHRHGLHAAKLVNYLHIHKSNCLKKDNTVGTLDQCSCLCLRCNVWLSYQNCGLCIRADYGLSMYHLTHEGVSLKKVCNKNAFNPLQSVEVSSTNLFTSIHCFLYKFRTRKSGFGKHLHAINL